MNRNSNQEAIIDPVTREAAAWFARLRADDATERDRARFRHWLEADPRHREAYAGFERFWSTTGDYAGHEAVADEVRTAERLAVRQSPPQRRRRIPRPALRAAQGLAAAGVLAVAGALLWEPFQESRGIYTTAVGEQRSIPLADGSRVMLNTDTRIRVAYSERARTVHLEDGQGYFRVAKNPERPFYVETENGRVRAVGTEFEVYENAGEVVVTVIEGSVAVSERGADKTAAETRQPAPAAGGSAAPARSSGDTPAAAPAEKLLEANERIALAPGRVLRKVSVEPAPLKRSVAWTSGRLVFDDEPLSEAINEVNRYSKQRVLIGDARLKSLHISGVFRVGDTGDFVNTVSEYFSLRLENRGGDYVLTVPGRAAG
jgi:transmembrane sensor